MKTTTRALYAGVLWGLCLTTFAAEPRQPAPPRGPATQQLPADATNRPAAAAPAASQAFIKASDLIGMTVKGTGNTDLGEVEDLLIDGRSNQIQYLVLDTGVFADLGGKQPVIPWALVEPHFVGESSDYFLMTAMTTERIKTAPAINTNDIDLSRSAEWTNLVNHFYAEDLKHRNVSRPDLDADQRRDPNDARSGQPRTVPQQPGSGQQPNSSPQPRTPIR